MTIAQGGSPGSKIDKMLVGEPIVVGERTVQLVARLAGWYGQQGGATGGGGGAALRLSPVEVIVREDDGSEYSVPIVHATREAIRGMAVGALVIGLLGFLLLTLLRLKRVKAEKSARRTV